MTKVHNYTQVAVAEPIPNEEQHFVGKTVVVDDEDDCNNTHASNVTRPGPTVTPTTPKYDVDVAGSRSPVVLSYCPHCSKQDITTRTKTTATGATWVAGVAGFVIFAPLVLVPFCVRSMQQTNHHCPNCGVKVGKVPAFHQLTTAD